LKTFLNASAVVKNDAV